ncbi:MAG: thioredoxin family protein [Lacisediminihabitans sp.]
MNAPLVFGLLVGLVGFATALGLLWRSQTGRVRGAANNDTVIELSEIAPDAVAGSGATLLQFSTEVCAPCTATHSILGDIARDRGDVTHVDIDMTRRTDLASRFNILQSPTTFILDARGVVRARIGGAPRRAEVTAALDRILPLVTAA